jgi:hypothetical protein
MVPFYSVLMEQTTYTRPFIAHFEVEVTHRLKSPASHIAHILIGSLKGEIVYYRRMKLSELKTPWSLDVPVEPGTQLKIFVIDEDTGEAAHSQKGRGVSAGATWSDVHHCCACVCVCSRL